MVEINVEIKAFCAKPGLLWEFRRASKRAFESCVSRETLPFDQTEDGNLAKNARCVSRETFAVSRGTVSASSPAYKHLVSVQTPLLPVIVLSY
jgi:predicted dienelactone hydrolase